MKCDVCDEEVANSEELKAHMERVHPVKEDEGEKPDFIENPEGETNEARETTERIR